MNYKVIIFVILVAIGSLYYVTNSYFIPTVAKFNQNQVDYQAYTKEILK